jgi:hypothetical protein
LSLAPEVISPNHLTTTVAWLLAQPLSTCRRLGRRRRRREREVLVDIKRAPCPPRSSVFLYLSG